MIAEANDIHELLIHLRPSSPQEPGQRQIAFEVGKLGRFDRFVLRMAGPSVRREMSQLLSEQGERTAQILATLDELVEKTDLGFLYNNPTEAKYGYCIWARMNNRQDWACRMSLPLYRSRMEEQRRIINGEINRGHRVFGFYPLDGYG